MKKCSKCKETLSITSFYKHKGSKDGIHNRCKKCEADRQREYMAKKYAEDPLWVLNYRRKYREAYRKNPKKQVQDPAKHREHARLQRIKFKERSNARELAQKIAMKPCEVCGDPNSERHHPDYSKPLEVMFLCRKHHEELHIEEREKELLQLLAQ